MNEIIIANVNAPWKENFINKSFKLKITGELHVRSANYDAGDIYFHGL